MSIEVSEATRLPEWLAHINPSCLTDCDPQLFEIVRAAYNSDGRFYHTWQHIMACLAEFANQEFNHPQVALLALLFHDAIYIPGRKDNEEKSAVFAEQIISKHSKVSIEDRQEISNMILLTANHHAAHENLSDDAAKVIDIDLAILGVEWPIYETYAQNVRREFCPAVITEFHFRLGRIAFLSMLLQQPRIFLTDMMKKREVAALNNIEKELQMLRDEAGVFGRLILRFM